LKGRGKEEPFSIPEGVPKLLALNLSGLGGGDSVSESQNR